MRIDLNADVGEGGYGPGRDVDRLLMPHVTSVSIACGFHAGTPATMLATVELALEHNVAIGAHPSFADREGFGRREMQVPPGQVEDLVFRQIEALAAIAATRGARLQHVKPHGALYNQAARDSLLAMAIARAVDAFDPGLILVGLAGSELVAAARQMGLRAASEGFADRAYRSDGTLVPRGEPDAVMHDVEAVVEQAVRLVRDHRVVAPTGAQIPMQVDTLCIHGDTPDAAVLAAALRQALVDAGSTVAALGSD